VTGMDKVGVRDLDTSGTLLGVAGEPWQEARSNCGSKLQRRSSRGSTAAGGRRQRRRGREEKSVKKINHRSV
jgi:hypothetical protein